MPPMQPRSPSPAPPKPPPLFPPVPPGTINIRLLTDQWVPPPPPPNLRPRHHRGDDLIIDDGPRPPSPPISPRPRPRHRFDHGIPLPPPGHRMPPPPGPPGPPSVIVVRSDWSRNKDAFYGAWDRFTLQKQRSRKDEQSSRTQDRRGRPSQRHSRSQEGSEEISESVKKPATADIVPGLDTDVEGRPTQVSGANNEGVKTKHKAGESFEAAAQACRTKVDAIVQECKRLNQKYCDRQFNLPDWDCLVHLAADDTPTSVKDLMGVGAVKRVEDIFDEPEFFEDGPTPQDIRQGNIGNCYFLAALGALGGKPSLIEKLCVARDEMVGVYGFVFFRDGEWVSEIVDDRLCLRYSDDVAKNPTDFLVVTRGDKNAMQQPLSDMSYAVQRLPKDFYQSLRKGSSALYFGSCRESNETWLPLIEKAYAKAHGDYQAIDGGVTGEGIEDLTGGVASFVRSENVLDKDKLWQELMQVNENFLFGCGTRKGRDSESADDEGFVRGHAYTVLAAHEIDAPPIDDRIKRSSKKRKDEEEKRKKEIKNGKVRLLKLHNPWGRQEFNGDWSDMSNRWTPELLKELGHTIGDDGTFFISYIDFLKFFPVIDRIRLINHDWTVCQQWTSVNVPWTTDYLDTSFKFTITKEGPVVIVLSQPDTRYFKGLTGRHKFSLHFRLYKEGEDTYLLRSMEQSGNMRSCNAEVDLKAGTYELLLKVTAERFEEKRTAQQIIHEYRDERREKLLAIGKSFDLAHAKGRLRDLEKNNLATAVKEGKARAKERLARGRDIRQKQRIRGKRQRRRAFDEVERKREEKKKKHEEKRAKRREEKRQEREKRAKAEPLSDQEPEKRRSTSPIDRLPETEEPEIKDGEISQQEIAQEATLAGSKDVPESSEKSQKPLADVPKAQQETPAATPVAEPTETTVLDGERESVTEEDRVVVFEPLSEVKAEDKEETQDDDKAVDEVRPHADRPRSRSRESPTLHDSRAADEQRPALPPRHRTQDGMPPQHNRDIIIVDDRYRHGSPMRGPPMRSHMMTRRRERSADSQASMMSDRGIPSPISSVADEDFPWDSEIDGPASLADSYDSESASDSYDDMYANDPWHATCVVGLRLCTMDENVDIEVVRGSQNRGIQSEIAMGRARSPA